MKKVDPLSWSLTAGIVWGASCMIISLLATFAYGAAFVEVLGSLYPGYYPPGIISAVLGLLYGFFCLFVGTYAAILIHNRLVDYLR